MIGEGVAGEALDVEADGSQLLQVRLQHRAFGGTAFVEQGSEEMLGDRSASLDALPVAVVEDALVRHVLVDEAKPARGVEEDVAHPVLPDDASLEVAEGRLGL